MSSTFQIVTDIHGNEKKKKKLGGAYPGQRRPQHQQYAPPASEFDQNGQAVAHFMAYGGGNALTLVQNDGSNKPQSGKTEPQFIQGKNRAARPKSLCIPCSSNRIQSTVVTLPEGVSAGQTIHVQSPNGQTNAIVVPAGFGPGSTFTVEFAEEEAPPPAKADFAQPVYAAPTNTGTNGNVNADDGFASGFNNPGWTSPPASAVPANDTLVYAEPDIQLGSSYPTTTATPVYNTAPQYPK